MSDALLALTGIFKSFGAGDKRLEVLKGIDLSVRRGECLAIMGPSGAGKSTLLHIAGGLMVPSAGRVQLGDRSLQDLPDPELARVRNQRFGFVFQMHHLLPEFTALENVSLPALLAGTPRAASWARARELLRQVGLQERAAHRPGELSGGEQQRVAIARALINEPDVLLADEPTGDLDSATADGIHELLLGLNRDRGQTLVMVTHNPELTRFAERVIVLRSGRIEKEGTAE